MKVKLIGHFKTRWHSRKLLDVSKINKLGWKSQISIERGISDTIKSFLYEYRNKLLRF